MEFGHLLKVFRSVSLDFIVKLFVKKQVMLPATLTDIESESLCCKNTLIAKLT